VQAPEIPCDIFLSWSGEAARQIAPLLKTFFKFVLGVDSFFSESDIPGGEFWNDQVRTRLQEAKIGVIVLTPSNLYEPWLAFEAGAIAFRDNNHRCCPLLFGDVSLDRLPSPFQALKDRPFEHNHIRMLVEEIGKALSLSVDAATIGDRFETKWRRLQKDVDKVLHAPAVPARILRRQDVPLIPPTLQILRDRWHDSKHKDFKLFSFYGLNDNEAFSRIQPVSSREVVYHLWADPLAGGTISAKVLPGEELTLRVRFDNKSAHSGNVAVRPVGRHLLQSNSPNGFTRLRFEIRIPEDGRAGGDADEVRVAVRIVDRFGTHWRYRRHQYYRWFDCLEVGKWHEIAIDLANPKLEDWDPFEYDGNFVYRGEIPDFSKILAVVIEVGKASEIEVPAVGPGVLDIAEFSVE